MKSFNRQEISRRSGKMKKITRPKSRNWPRLKK